MACFAPLEGYRKRPDEKGRSGFTPSARLGYPDQPLKVPCGQCIGCRLERSRQWAIRCVHEASQHQDNCFVTPTYNDDNLPYGSTLVRSDIQKFHRALRKKGIKLRFFYCGEYGEQLDRPHYHTLLFGFDPSDKKPAGKSITGETLYESDLLTKTWNKGHVNLGAVSFESAAYVARYCTKKITGPMAETHYQRTDPDTGEVFNLLPEFIGMSLKPGIGADWLEKYGKDSYAKDEIIVRGKAMLPPRYYDKTMEKKEPSIFLKTRAARSRATFLKHSNPDPTETYLGSFNHYKARVKIAEQKLQKRNLK